MNKELHEKVIEAERRSKRAEELAKKRAPIFWVILLGTCLLCICSFLYMLYESKEDKIEVVK